MQNFKNDGVSQEKTFTKTNKKQLKLLKIKNRIWELDFVRGICIILMIWDHSMVLCSNFFVEAWAEATLGTSSGAFFQDFYFFVEGYLSSTIRGFVQPLVVVCFFTLCGISCAFSRNNAKRGLVMLACSVGISVVTYFLGIPIWFGALHLLTLGVLLWCVIAAVCKKHNDFAMIFCFSAAVLFFFLDTLFSALPNVIDGNFLAIFGEYFAPSGFYSSDYYPILPYVGFVLLGVGIGLGVYAKKQSKLPFLASKQWYKPINFFGRKGLIIYVAHQVIIGAILSLISFFFITKGDFLIF